MTLNRKFNPATDSWEVHDIAAKATQQQKQDAMVKKLIRDKVPCTITSEGVFIDAADQSKIKP